MDLDPTKIILSLIAALISFLLYRSNKKLIDTKITVETLKKQNDSNTYEKYNELTQNIDHKVSSYLKHAVRHPIASKYNYDYFSDNYSFNSISNIDSLFKLRSIHFHEEKIKICKHLIKVICTNDHFLEKDKIYLCLDSGSTILPIFNMLCKYYWDSSYSPILKKITVLTNNLPGVSVLTGKGRKGVSVNAEMIYDCHVIPGLAEGKYSATLSEDGANYLLDKLETIKNEEKNSIIVSAITGNYLSTEDGVLWRGDNHGKLKNSMITLADYIYILSPLGKIFPNTCDEINNTIMKPKIELPVSKEYQDLRSEDASVKESMYSPQDLKESQITFFLPDLIAGGKKIFLVTTTREEQKICKEYPTSLYGYFSRLNVRLEQAFKTNLITIPFVPSIEAEQVIAELMLYKIPDEAFLNYEFPHKIVRDYMRGII